MGKKELVHGRRLKLFSNKDYEVWEQLQHHFAYQKKELLVIEDCEYIRLQNGNIELLVKWTGFDKNKLDWVDFKSLKNEAHELLREYLEDTKKGATRRQRNAMATIERRQPNTEVGYGGVLMSMYSILYA